ncbi:MAG: quinolinate synthase NadA, partial [Caldilineaceae bacterium]|nr:quinolinate synthase NadA [Caldilineaceae bacterium]
ARNVARETGKKIFVPSRKDLTDAGADLKPDVSMIGWSGKCEVHELFTPQDVTDVRKQFPDVVVLAHPECSPEVVDAADYSQSTSKMIDYVKQSNAPYFLLLTECSMGDNIIAENPDKEILRLCSHRCPHMGEITLEDTLRALRENVQIIEVEENTRLRAKQSVERMLAI